MKVFLTGATGFVGAYLVPELISAGHHVLALSRTTAGAEKLASAGAEVYQGDVNDLARLRSAAELCDGVIHMAFNHDFSQLEKSSDDDRKVIAALGEALADSEKPLLVTSGTGLVKSTPGVPAMESDAHLTSAEFPRAATEEAADALIANCQNVMIIRLPQVHDVRRQGRITQHVLLARQHGYVAYIGAGKNRVPAVHASDAARLFRLALEQGSAGTRYHAVDEEGVSMYSIAHAIGAGLEMPVMSIGPEQASDYFGPMAMLAAMDLAACGTLTRQQLGWHPTGPGLLTDLGHMDYHPAHR